MFVILALCYFFGHLIAVRVPLFLEKLVVHVLRSMTFFDIERFIRREREGKGADGADGE